VLGKALGVPTATFEYSEIHRQREKAEAPMSLVDNPITVANATSLVASWNRLTADTLTSVLDKAAQMELNGLALVGQWGIADVVVDRLLQTGHLGRLRWLDLSGVPIGDRGLHDLVSSPQAGRLETLILGALPRRPLGLLDPGPKPWSAMATCGIGDHGLQVLATSPHLGALRSLSLEFPVASPETLQAFVTSALMSALTAFGLMHIKLTETVVAGLCRRATRLRSLAFSNCGLDYRVAGLLAGADARPAIERLAIPSNGWTINDLRTLFDAGWPGLEVLDLSEIHLDENAARFLAGARGMPALRRLILTDPSNIPTDEHEVWYDEYGVEMGGGVKYMRLHDVRKTYFTGAGFEIVGPGQVKRWPQEWMPGWPATFHSMA